MNLNGQGPQQLQTNQSATGTWQLCSLACRMQFLRRWLRVHLQECARLGKPLVIGCVGRSSCGTQCMHACSRLLAAPGGSACHCAMAMLWLFLLRLPKAPGLCSAWCREFGSQRPMDVRNTVYRTLYDTVAQSARQGLPIAGAASLLHF